jgi:hypothetical protein
MKKLIYMVLILLYTTKNSNSQHFSIKSIKKEDEYRYKFPVRGLVRIKPTPVPEFIQIDFFVYNNYGYEIYFANSAIGILMSMEVNNLSTLVDEGYKKLMLKNGFYFKEKNFKKIQFY